MAKTLPSNLTRGDSGKLRKCLHAAGFNQLRARPQGWYGRWDACSDVTIFSDARKDSRRLKVWFADNIFNAKQNKQQHLEQLLMREFGKRWRGANFTQSVYYWRNWKSFCVYLSK